MVADTIQTKIVTFLYTIFLFSCSDTVIIQESDLINGMTVQQFIRDYQYTGIIEIYYPNNQLKSLRKYSGGKKYGKHKGWWENGNQQYEYYFKDDQNAGRHMQWHSNGKLFIVTLSDPLPAVLAVVDVPLPLTTIPAASAILITTPEAG